MLARRQFLKISLLSAAIFSLPGLSAGAEKNPGLPDDFIALNLHSAGFNLHAWLRPGEGPMLHVFIEGDGHIWKNFNQPSSDPTPRNPVSAALAADTPLPGPVLYLARPGQYASAAELERLDAKWWTSHRYAAAVVQAICGVVEQGLKRSSTDRLGLYGHSGGGALAVLAAPYFKERLNFLASIASPLDTRLWAEIHRNRLSHSLNPKSAAAALRPIKQTHLSGAKDDIVPTRVLDSWLSELAPRPEWVRRVVVPDAGHQGPWLSSWRLVLARAMAPDQL